MKKIIGSKVMSIVKNKKVYFCNKCGRRISRKRSLEQGMGSVCQKRSKAQFIDKIYPSLFNLSSVKVKKNKFKERT